MTVSVTASMTLSPPQPTISLCIPTFNRCSLLRIALDTILEQITPAINDQVEIVVADNASPDATQQVVQKVIDLHPHVTMRYFRQTQNTGSDGNIQTLLKIANGKFVYFLSDDDLLLTGALEKLLALITSNPTLDAFCLNIRPFQHDVSELSAPCFAVSEDTIIRDKNEMLNLISTQITYLSIFAFRRDLVSDKDYTTWVGSYIVQSYYFVDVLAHEGGLLITSQPYLGLRDNNSAGYSFFQAFVTNYAALLNYAQEKQGFAGANIHRLMQEHLRLYLFGMVFSRFKLAGGFGSIKPRYWDGIRRLLTVYGMDTFLLFKFLPVILMPPSVLRPSYAAYSRIKRLIKPVKTPAQSP